MAIDVGGRLAGRGQLQLVLLDDDGGAVDDPFFLPFVTNVNIDEMNVMSGLRSGDGVLGGDGGGVGVDGGDLLSVGAGLIGVSDDASTSGGMPVGMLQDGWVLVRIDERPSHHWKVGSFHQVVVVLDLFGRDGEHCD